MRIVELTVLVSVLKNNANESNADNTTIIKDISCETFNMICDKMLTLLYKIKGEVEI